MYVGTWFDYNILGWDIIIIDQVIYNFSYIYIYTFSRRFYPKRLTVHSGLQF